MNAIRFTLACDVRGGVRVEGEQRLQKNVVATNRLIGNFKGQCGFWIEVKDAAGQVLYRQVMHDPTTHWESAADLMRRRRVRRRAAAEAEAFSGLFSIVVPELENAASVLIMASRPSDALARPILTIPLESRA